MVKRKKRFSDGGRRRTSLIDRLKTERVDFQFPQVSSFRNLAEYHNPPDSRQHFVPKAATIVGVPEGAVRPLIRERDTDVREKSILSVKKSLESGFKPGKGIVGKGNTLTAKDIKQIVEQVKKEKL